MSYTKLDSSIIASTVWMGSLELKAVWITMLAMKNERQVFEGSLPGLAKLAGVSIEQAQVALEVLLSPDPHSRSKEFDGRRIEPVDGGWVILNGTKYRDKARGTDRTQYMREAKQRQRDRERADASTTVNQSQPGVTKVTEQSRAEQSKEEKREKKLSPPRSQKKPKKEPLPEQFPENVVLPSNLSEITTFCEAWRALIAERKRHHVVMTEFAAKLQLRRLSEWAFRRGSQVAIEAVENATAGGDGKPWQGVFEPEERKGSPPRASVSRASEDKTNIEIGRRSLTEKAFAAFAAGRLTEAQRDELVVAVEKARTMAALQEIRWPV